MKSLSPRVMGSRATWVAAGVNQSEFFEEQRCYRTAEKRGGGAKGSMVRGISMDLAASAARATSIPELANVKDGSTNANAVTTALSVSWQQDIEQAIRPLVSWPQSKCESASAGAAFRW
jgi:hypothetical protein